MTDESFSVATLSVPLLTKVLPVYVFVPAKTTVPEPTLRTPPLPENGVPRVNELSPCPTGIVAPLIAMTEAEPATVKSESTGNAPEPLRMSVPANTLVAPV